MQEKVTILAPITLAAGRTEAELLSASNQFQDVFVSKYDGVLRRELIKTGENRYMDIVQFRSQEDAERVIEAEATSEDCAAFFSLMDLSDMDENLDFHRSLATYDQKS